MSDPTPEQIRWQLAAMSRRRFLGRSGLALGGLALGPEPARGLWRGRRRRR